jgi:hypothetical protein
MRIFSFILLDFISILCFPSDQYMKTFEQNKVLAGAHELQPLSYPPDSWPFFLQHLPSADKPILDFTGKPIDNQEKHFRILTYDVGTSDLQQCADALMRVRTEYLFSRKKYDQIGFHFNSGIYFSYADYLKGIRPVFRGNHQVLLQTTPPAEIQHGSLRKYLDLVFNYANTVSLCRELKTANQFETGTVIIFPGNPGHCMIIADQATIDKKDTVFKLVEGYMPAQSIYILSNPFEPELSPWYHLKKGEINTASCSFKSYFLKKFE